MKDNPPIQSIARALAAAALAASLSLALPSCDNAAAEAQAAPEKSGAEADVGSVVTGAKRSKHFDAVSQHLNLGGTVYGYMDIDGDVEKFADLIQGLLDRVVEEGAPPHLEKLKLSKVLADLGLDGVEALGMSSIKKGKLHHNRAYAHIPAGRKGLLKIVGGDASPFAANKLAPADTDLIIEQSLNIRAGYEVVSAMVLHFGGPDASREFQAGVGEPIPDMGGLSVAEILGRLDTRLTLVGRVHPDKPIDVPEVPMDFPSFDLLIALDDAGWLFDKIIVEGKKQVPPGHQAEVFAKGEGWEKIMAPPIPSPDMVIMQPVIYHDHASKRVLVASTQAFLDECLSGKSSIADNDAFKTAIGGLPSEGNGLSYVSPGFVKAYRDLMQEVVKNSPVGTAEVVIVKLLDLFMPDTGLGQASVMANTPEGILMASNSVHSYKDGAVAAGAALLTTMGTFVAKSSVQIEEPPIIIEEEAARPIPNFPDPESFDDGR